MTHGYPGYDPETIGRIKHLVCEVWKIPPFSMWSPRRSKEWAWPRQAAMHLGRHYAPDLSYPSIAHAFGNRDHTTVIHACRTVDRRLRETSGPAKRFAALYFDAEMRIQREMPRCPHCGARLTREHLCADCGSERETAPQHHPETPARQAA